MRLQDAVDIVMTTESEAQRAERNALEDAHMVQYADTVVTKFLETMPETLAQGEDALKLSVRAAPVPQISNTHSLGRRDLSSAAGF